MAYKKYIVNCVLGAALWVGGVTSLGYLLGKNQFIQDNFEMVIFGIIGISLLPIVVEFIKVRMLAKKA